MHLDLGPNEENQTGAETRAESHDSDLEEVQLVQDRGDNNDDHGERGEEGSNLFMEICRGRLMVTRKNWKEFLEAICAHPDPGLCFQLLTNGATLNGDASELETPTPPTPTPPGLVAFNRALNMDYSYFFYEDLFTRLIMVIRRSDILSSHIEVFIRAILDPTVFWGSLISTIWRMNLGEETMECVAWLVWKYYEEIYPSKPRPQDVIGSDSGSLTPTPPTPSTPHSAIKLFKGDYVFEILQSSRKEKTREIAEKLQALLPPPPMPAEYKAKGYKDTDFDVEDFDVPPTGRHDNDFEDFRKIAVVPTPGEMNSKRLPFLPKMSSLGGGEEGKTKVAGEGEGEGEGGDIGKEESSVEVGAVERETETEQRQSRYLEAQFRLYREETIENLRHFMRGSPGVRLLGSTTPFVELTDVVVDSAKGNRRRWALAFRCSEELPFFGSCPPSPSAGTRNLVLGSDGVVRKVKTAEYRKIVASGAWWTDGALVLIVDGKDEVVGVGTYVRDVERLAESPSVILVSLNGTEDVVEDVLKRVKRSQTRAKGKGNKAHATQKDSEGGIRLMISTVPVSYAFSVLEHLQTRREVPFREEMLFSSVSVREPENVPSEFLRGMESNPDTIDVGQLFGFYRSISLDKQQKEVVSSALRERICLIQGFPSTGKSLLASVITKVLYEHTSQKILILSNDDNSLTKVFKELTTHFRIPTTKMVSFTGVLTTPGIPEPVTMKGQVAAHQLQTSSSSSVLVPLPPPLSPVPRSSAIPIPLSAVPSRTPSPMQRIAPIGSALQPVPSPISPPPPATEEVDQGLQSMIDSLVDLGNEVKTAFEEVFADLRLEKSFRTATTTTSTGGPPSSMAILEYLATKECEVEYLNAFRVLPEEIRDLESSESAEGVEVVLREGVEGLECTGPLESGKQSDSDGLKVSSESLEESSSPPTAPRIDSTYLFDRWRNGEDAGVLSDRLELSSNSAVVWKLSVEERRERVVGWERAIAGTTDSIDGACSLAADTKGVDTDTNEDDAGAKNDTSTDDVTDVHMSGEDDSIDMDAISRLYSAGCQYNVYQEIFRLRDKDTEFMLLSDKRVIGATKHNLSEIRDLITDNTMPEVVIVLGADSFLECELLMGLGGKTKHLIMFGDIPTKKPTISLPRLTAGFKKGHNLDISLFERLIQNRYPCHTLRTIHTADTSAGVPLTNANNAWGTDVQTWGNVPPGQQPLLAPIPPNRRLLRHKSSWSTVSSVSRPPSPSPLSKEPADTTQLVIQRKIGPTEKEWNRRKTDSGAINPDVDAIMAMNGIEEIKEKVLDILDTVELMKKQGRPMKEVTFNAALMGNPGTGMTAFAKLYYKFLKSIGVVTGDQFIEIGVFEAESFKVYVRSMRKGGMLHVVDAHKPGRYAWSSWLAGTSVDSVSPDALVQTMTKGAGKQAFIFSGSRGKMDAWLALNPGVRDALPYWFHFPDLDEEELLQVFEMRLIHLFRGKMKVEGGIDGPYARLAIQRLSGRRNVEGFGNEIEVHYLVDDVLVRQARRLAKLRVKEGGGEGGEGEGEGELDFMLITKEDLLNQYSKPIEESKAHKELQSLIGLAEVKATVDSLVKLVQVNTERQLKGKKPVQVMLNRVFLGPPGTGKTTVAKIYAKLLNEMGLLSTGEVVIKNANDFIGQYIGQSEANTKAILASAKGKVLIIDEAHILNPTASNCADVFKEDVIDSLVSGIHNVPGDGQCVLLLGYEDEMFEMFQNANPGLDRRFRISDAFYFPDFTTDELMQIFDAKLKEEELSASPAARKVASEMLDRARHRPNFGNGGAVDNMISNAKENYYGRFEVANFPDHVVFEPQDFDPDYDRGGGGSERLAALFEELVGCEDIMAKFEEYQIVSRTMRKCGKDARKVIPMNFIFKGPPGTGKTTIARKMGHIFYDMGFLASSEVVECSATDMIGSYLGQTGPKTQALFKKALGKVLFIDEAYRLCHGEYAQEAIGELVTLLTTKTYHMKMVVVLAGYDRDMDLLLLRNRGLASRFPEEIVFKDIEPDACLEILSRLLEKSGVRMKCLEEKGRDYRKMTDIIKKMSGTPAWGNARDMVSLSVHLIREAHKVNDDYEMEEAEMFDLSSKAALKHLIAMREEQEERASVHPRNNLSNQGQGEKFNPSAVLEQLNVARWRAVKQQLNGVNSSYSRTQFYNIPP